MTDTEDNNDNVNIEKIVAGLISSNDSNNGNTSDIVSDEDIKKYLEDNKDNPILKKIISLYETENANIKNITYTQSKNFQLKKKSPKKPNKLNAGIIYTTKGNNFPGLEFFNLATKTAYRINVRTPINESKQLIEFNNHLYGLSEVEHSTGEIEHYVADFSNDSIISKKKYDSLSVFNNRLVGINMIVDSTNILPKEEGHVYDVFSGDKINTFDIEGVSISTISEYHYTYDKKNIYKINIFENSKTEFPKSKLMGDLTSVVKTDKEYYSKGRYIVDLKTSSEHYIAPCNIESMVAGNNKIYCSTGILGNEIYDVDSKKKIHGLKFIGGLEYADGPLYEKIQCMLYVDDIEQIKNMNLIRIKNER